MKCRSAHPADEELSGDITHTRGFKFSSWLCVGSLRPRSGRAGTRAWETRTGRGAAGLLWDLLPDGRNARGQPTLPKGVPIQSSYFQGDSPNTIRTSCQRSQSSAAARMDPKVHTQQPSCFSSQSTLLLFAPTPSELDQTGQQTNAKGSQSENAQPVSWALALSSTFHLPLLLPGPWGHITDRVILYQPRHRPHPRQVALGPDGFMNGPRALEGSCPPGPHSPGPDLVRRGRALSRLLFCPRYGSADRTSCEGHLETKDGWTDRHPLSFYRVHI